MKLALTVILAVTLVVAVLFVNALPGADNNEEATEVKRDVAGDGVMIPEPATLSLLGLGGMVLILRRRRRRA